MEVRYCPQHPESALKLVAESQREAGGKTTVTEKYKCPVDKCGYTYTHSTTE